MAQVRATVPVNPPAGVTLIVDVFPVVAPGLTLIFPLFVMAYDAGAAAAIVTLTVVVCVIDPDTPVIVAV